MVAALPLFTGESRAKDKHKCSWNVFKAVSDLGCCVLASGFQWIRNVVQSGFFKGFFKVNIQQRNVLQIFLPDGFCVTLTDQPFGLFQDVSIILHSWSAVTKHLCQSSDLAR